MLRKLVETEEQPSHSEASVIAPSEQAVEISSESLKTSADKTTSHPRSPMIALWSLAGILFTSGVVYGTRVLPTHASNANLERELEAARREGIPVSAQDVRASIPTASPSENAASLYRQFGALTGSTLDTSKNQYLAVFAHDAKARDALRAQLASEAAAFGVIDEAAKRPKCWFNREWERGAGLLFPEYSKMRQGARMVLSRGCLEAAEGNVEGALRNAREAAAIARHARSEPVQIAQYMAYGIDKQVIMQLAEWAYAFPNQRAYYAEFERARKSLSLMSESDLARIDMHSMLELLDAGDNPSVLRDLGFPDDAEHQPSVSDRWAEFSAGFVDRGAAKAQLVQGYRDLVALYKSPATPQREAGIKAAKLKIERAFEAIPKLRRIYGLMYPASGSDQYAQLVDSTRLRFEALSRALRGLSLPHSIDTSDLVMPGQPLPVVYRLNGKQISIRLPGTGQGENSELTLPPNPPK